MKNKEYLFEIIAIAIILIIHLIGGIYAGTKKEYFHVDEFYSYGFINYPTNFITANDDFENNWHDSEYFKDYIEVNRNELKHLSPVYYNQAHDVHPPVYYTLLRIFASFNVDNFSMWTGIILNILISLAIIILIYLICKELFKNKGCALITTFIAAFSLVEFENIIFIRMYELFTFNVILLVYLHLIMFNKNLKWYMFPILGVCIFVGFLTHYYYIIFLGGLVLLFLGYLIYEKKFKDLIKYILTIGISFLLAIKVFPYAIQHLFLSERGQESIANGILPGNFVNKFFAYLNIISDQVFGGILIVFLFLLCCICIAGIVFKKIKKEKINVEIKNKEILILLVPVCMYILIVSKLAPYTNIRYIFPICLLFLIIFVYIMYKLLEMIYNKKSALIGIIIFAIINIILTFQGFKVLDFAYIGARDNLKLLEDKADIPCVYILDNTDYNFLYNIIPLTKIKETYPIRKAGLDDNINNMEEALKEKNIEKGILIFYSCEYDDQDKFLDEIMEKYNITEKDYLFNLGTDSLYYIHN